MNQKQREYLTGRIRDAYDEQRKSIEKERMRLPNLNNYLLAAFMDGSIEFGDLDQMRRNIKERVLAGGDKNAIVERRRDTWRDDDDGPNDMVVSIPVFELFKMPKDYAEARQKCEEHNRRVEERLKLLSAQFDTLVTKVNLGSDKALAGLIAEADSLVDISLMNSKLLLNA